MTGGVGPTLLHDDSVDTVAAALLPGAKWRCLAAYGTLTMDSALGKLASVIIQPKQGGCSSRSPKLGVVATFGLRCACVGSNSRLPTLTHFNACMMYMSAAAD